MSKKAEKLHLSKTLGEVLQEASTRIQEEMEIYKQGTGAYPAVGEEKYLVETALNEYVPKETFRELGLTVSFVLWDKGSVYIRMRFRQRHPACSDILYSGLLEHFYPYFTVRRRRYLTEDSRKGLVFDRLELMYEEFENVTLYELVTRQAKKTVAFQLQPRSAADRVLALEDRLGADAFAQLLEDFRSIERVLTRSGKQMTRENLSAMSMVSDQRFKNILRAITKGRPIPAGMEEFIPTYMKGLDVYGIVQNRSTYQLEVVQGIIERYDEKEITIVVDESRLNSTLYTFPNQEGWNPDLFMYEKDAYASLVERM